MRRLLQALNVLQRMREDADVEMDAVSYSSGIIACERGGRSEEAVQLLKAMQAAGYRPSGYTYAVRYSLLSWLTHILDGERNGRGRHI